ncbi:MAG: hypothetical protein ACYSW6_10015 [Planctomycetota bacterium]|jgi:hypothetical protein
MIAPSTAYKLADPYGKIIAEGSATKIRRLKKEKGPGYKIWNSAGSKVGDWIGNGIDR